MVLDCSRVKEFTGDIDGARLILKKYRAEIYMKSNGKKHAPWKIYLETLLVEKRDGKIDQAILQTKRALKVHSGTGRLWAMLIQLEHQNGPQAQFNVLRKALNEVPKSGEVWCEAARLHMDPLSIYFDLGRASQYLDFAIQVCSPFSFFFDFETWGGCWFVMFASVCTSFGTHPFFINNSFCFRCSVHTTIRRFLFRKNAVVVVVRHAYSLGVLFAHVKFFDGINFCCNFGAFQ